MGIFVKLSASILPTNKSWPMQLHIIDKVIDETNNKIISFLILY